MNRTTPKAHLAPAPAEPRPTQTPTPAINPRDLDALADALVAILVAHWRKTHAA